MRVLTLAAIACAAYLVADVAHEGLGHGGACLALGGRVLLLDTTFEDCSIHARLIDGAGPVIGILAALLAWAGTLCTRANLRVFCTLLFAFAAFWNIGYMLKSGLMWSGDWHFVIQGLEPAGTWHIGLAVLGAVLYVAAMRVLARIWPTGDGMSSVIFALAAFLTAALLSAAGGVFDPRGPSIVLSDALPSSLSAIGLLLVGVRRVDAVAVAPSPGWIAAGLAAAALFVAVLGPGLRF